MTIRTAIVTGAAKGIGKAISEQFVLEDYITILVDVDEKAGTELARNLGASVHLILYCRVACLTDFVLC